MIGRGAEAVLIHYKDKIIKKRIKKGYRIPELDIKLRKERTNKEAKLLIEARRIGVPVPIVYEKDLEDMKIIMEFIPGKVLRDYLGKASKEEREKICKQIGENIALLHQNDIIQGDLTTSNMIFYKDKVYFIDFGLGFFSKRIEDKAIDLHLLKEALIAKHHKIWKDCFDEILEGYNVYPDAKKVIERLEKVEKRGRYIKR